MKQKYVYGFCESAPSMEGSPGSRVHSSRGALLEMPLRFLRTLLMMLPTPPEPCGRCRPPVLGLLPPPAAAWSLSCLIGNRPTRSAHRLVPTQSRLPPPPSLSSTAASLPRRPKISIDHSANRVRLLPVFLCP